jgi:hypothetical protein
MHMYIVRYLIFRLLINLLCCSVKGDISRRRPDGLLLRDGRCGYRIFCGGTNLMNPYFYNINLVVFL